MGEIRVGCQTGAWGERRWGHLEETLAGVAEAGYEGVEIGARFLDLDDPEGVGELLDQYHLTLAGLHTGASWHDPDAVEGATPNMLKIVDVLAALGCENLIVSGRSKEGGTQPEDLRQMAQALNDMGRRCRERDVTLHYHNHGCEIQKDYEGVEGICEMSDPRNVSLAVDLGHVVKPGGGDPRELVRNYLDRIGYLHLKDVRDDEFVPVGRGDIDFPAVLAILREEDFEGWAVVENEMQLEDMTPVQCISVSRRYVRGVLGL